VNGHHPALLSITGVKNSKGNAVIGGVQYRGKKNLRFPAEIAFYIGNGMAISLIIIHHRQS